MGEILEKRNPTVLGLQIVWAVFLLSLGSGIIGFVGVGLVAVAMRLSVHYAFFVSGVLVLAVWGAYIGKVYGLFWSTETVREVAAVEVVKSVVQVELSEPETGRWSFMDLPGGPGELEELARGVLLGRPFSEAEWTGNGRPYSRAEFRSLRSVLLERGVLEWRNADAPSQGVALTRPGRAVFGELARTHTDARGAAELPRLGNVG